MLYLIGVAHRAQARKPGVETTKEQHAFEWSLRRATQEFQPVFIAEEDNEEFLVDRGELSIAKEVAGELGIEHRFCEPNKTERSARGSKNFMEVALDLAMSERLSDDELAVKARAIEIARYFQIRERFWLERLTGCQSVAAVFVCGDIHIESFGRLLKAEGIEYTVVERGVGVGEKDDLYYRAMEYLNVHPELRRD